MIFNENENTCEEKVSTVCKLVTDVTTARLIFELCTMCEVRVIIGKFLARTIN